jgi:hypothetical protein
MCNCDSLSIKHLVIEHIPPLFLNIAFPFALFGHHFADHFFMQSRGMPSTHLLGYAGINGCFFGGRGAGRV